MSLSFVVLSFVSNAASQAQPAKAATNEWDDDALGESVAPSKASGSGGKLTTSKPTPVSKATPSGDDDASSWSVLCEVDGVNAATLRCRVCNESMCGAW